MGSIAKKMLDETGSKLSKKTLENKLRQLFTAMDKGANIKENMQYAYDVADLVMSRVPNDEAVPITENEQEMLDYIRKTKIYLDPAAADEVRTRYDNVQNFMRKNFGKAKFTVSDKSALRFIRCT